MCFPRDPNRFHPENSVNHLKKIGLALLVVSVAGCGGDDGPKTYETKGKVTIDGAPAPDLIVNFMPTDGGLTEGSGVTNSDGTFSVSSGSTGKAGLEPGTYKVYLAPVPGEGPSEGAEDYNNADPNAANDNAPYPKEWGQPATTPLEVTIKEEVNQVNVEVKKGG